MTTKARGSPGGSRLDGSESRPDWRIRWGIIGTVAWVVLVIGWAFSPCWSVGCEPMPPAALGDFLSGLAAPLAFGWFVIAVFLQRDELRQNSEALRLQALELRAQVKQATRIAEEAVSARQREEGAAQPLLIVDGGNVSGGRVNRRICNRGAMVTEVEPDWDDPDLSVTLPPVFYGGGSQFGRAEWLILRLPAGFSIRYRDGHGVRQSQTYRFKNLDEIALVPPGKQTPPDSGQRDH